MIVAGAVGSLGFFERARTSASAWAGTRWFASTKARSEWLNEHTDDECSFFLVEIEVWRIGVEVCVSSDKEFGKVVFDHQEELEQLLGAKGEPYDAKKSCGIRFYRENCDVKGKPEMWGDYIAWQLHAAVLLREAIIDIDEAYLAETDE